MKELTLKEIENLLGYEVKIVAKKSAEVGNIVEVAGIEWIVLDKNEDSVLCLAKDFIYKNMKFDNNTNNYADSDIRKKLDKLADDIEKKIGKNNIYGSVIDLTSFDGLDDYGKVTDKIGLLTMDMYRQYNRIIEKYSVDDWWWLATPWSTPHRGYKYSVVCVTPNGRLGNVNYGDINGVRPFCRFVSSLFES